MSSNTLQFIFILSFDLSESIVLIKLLCSFTPSLFQHFRAFYFNSSLQRKQVNKVEILKTTFAITILLTSTHLYFQYFMAVEMILHNQKNSAGNFTCICNESTPGSRLKCRFILQVFCFIHLPEGDLNQIILSFRNINWL